MLPESSRPSWSVTMGRLIACLALVAVIAAVGGAVTAPAIPEWYRGLAKPSWTPPEWVFPVVWPVLYLMIAASLFRLWQKVPPSPERSTALGLFATQLALNAAWSPVFFGLRGPQAGVLLILALLLALAFTLRAVFRLDAAAGWLLVPYSAWVCYASTLNVAIAILN